MIGRLGTIGRLGAADDFDPNAIQFTSTAADVSYGRPKGSAWTGQDWATLGTGLANLGVGIAQAVMTGKQQQAASVLATAQSGYLPASPPMVAPQSAGAGSSWTPVVIGLGVLGLLGVFGVVLLKD